MSLQDCPYDLHVDVDEIHVIHKKTSHNVTADVQNGGNNVSSMTLAIVCRNDWDACYHPCRGGCTISLTHPLCFHWVLLVVGLASYLSGRISIASL